MPSQSVQDTIIVTCLVAFATYGMTL